MAAKKSTLNIRRGSDIKGETNLRRQIAESEKPRIHEGELSALDDRVREFWAGIAASEEEERSRMTFAELREAERELREDKEHALQMTIQLNLRNEILRSMTGPMWEKELTRTLHWNLVEQYPPPQHPTNEDTTSWELLLHEVEKALISRDIGFFSLMAKSLAALNAAFPQDPQEIGEFSDKNRYIDGIFIRNYWAKHGRGPEQREVRENLKRRHAESGPQCKPDRAEEREKLKPLPQDGCYAFMARTTGRPAKAKKASKNK